MQMQFDIQGGDFSAAGEASSEVKKALKQLNIQPQTLRRIAVALYEAEVNVVAHAYRGTMTVDISPARILVQLQDEGPGIDDIGKAMEEGFSTASDKVREMGFGAGMGLPNIKKNSDEMHLTSTPGTGTTLEIIVNF
ncbi:MAG TPA: ATP-binding protein [Paludibacteraceae bacterium]|jgi:anti-sigma regulatory factor (Ser/Thr protein kinase)|nr:ATP-binding protein [Paludibacteraceae bacterium]